ncbi:MAG TPA: hypothetical protein VMS18_28515 [Candidatus Binatia bacterium]|nr:hypothetical protein [Candidatus Binatia bacterium]
MKKKTAKKGKAVDKKTAKKSRKKAVKKELNPGQVLKDISLLIEEEASEIAKAVIGEGKKGQLTPAKFLFEMAHIYPQALEATAPSKDEESLAETLLDRLKLPKTPVVHDELQKEEEEDAAVSPPKKEAVADSESGDEEDEEKAVTVH